MKSLIHRLSFSNKYWVFLSITVILPIIFFAAGVYITARLTLENNFNARNQSIACSQTFLVEEQINDLNTLLNQAAALNFENPEGLAEQLQPFLIHENLQTVDLTIFYQGTQVYPDSTANLPNQFPNEEQWRSESGSLTIPFWFSERSNLFGIRGLSDDKGITDNFVLVSAPIENIKYKLKDIPSGFGYAVLSQTGDLLFEQPSINGSLDLDQLPEIVPSAGKLNTEEEALVICSNNLQWRYIFSQPKLYNQSILSSLDLIMILIALGTFSLIGLLSIYGHRQFVIPLQEIHDRLVLLDTDEDAIPEPVAENLTGHFAQKLVSRFNLLLSRLKQAETREALLRESENRYSLAIRGANDGIWDWDLKKNFCHFSQRWRYMLGYTQESIRNTISEWFTRVHPDDITALKADINAHLEGQTPHFENEHRIRHADGTYIWVLARGLAIYDEDGKASRFAGAIGDISKQKANEVRLLHDAMHDPLTNLPNRVYFTEMLDNALGRTQRREDYHAAVIYMDLDRFKVINDSLGHQIGDTVLKEVTQRLQQCLRTMDTVARFGGDEFAILLEEINGLQDAIHIARRILQETKLPIQIPNQELVINTSIGIVLITRGYQNAAEILRDADTAMYQAKANGRGKFEVFDKDMHAYTLNKLRLEGDLRRAMNNKEFKVFYQPIVDAKSKTIRYVEALLRWQHPQKGLIQTDAFIPLAEESGLIASLNKWVLHTACAEAHQWINNGFADLIVSVNISPTLLSNPDLADSVRGALSDYEIPPEALQLEITESTGVYESGIAIQNLYELTSIGVKICLDDYGLVASSLEQLKRLPISGIKIAQSFIRDLPFNTDDAAISQAIIAMAQILGIQVFGEGIETKEQMEHLTDNKIDFLQGFYFAHPLHRSEFLNHLISYGTYIEDWDSNNS